LNHVFITGKDDLDEDYGTVEEDVKPKEQATITQKYINDGFEFDEIEKDGYVSPDDPFSSDDDETKEEEKSPAKKKPEPKKNLSLGFDDLLNEENGEEDDEDFL
jgi:hypothetical protein